MATTTTTEVIMRALAIAQGVGMDGHDSPLLDAEQTAETLLEHVFRHVAGEYAKDPRKHSSVMQSYTINFTNGAGTLPGQTLSEHVTHASFYNSDESAVVLLSYCPFWFDFVRRKSIRQLLGYYAVDVGSSQVAIILPGADYDASGGFSGDLVMRTIGIPVLPSNPPMTFTVDDCYLDDVVIALAAALRGETPWAALQRDTEAEGA